jgi:hypothetical protein
VTVRQDVSFCPDDFGRSKVEMPSARSTTIRSSTWNWFISLTDWVAIST